MNALVVGGGGREHAISWALERSGRFEVVWTAPGNPGVSRPVPIGAHEIDRLVTFATSQEVDLVVVGPEAPLAAGLADRLRAAGVAVVGPDREAARIEWSKVFAKQLMERAGVPTAPFRVFSDPERALAYVRGAGRPLAVKADGLAGGKGVFVCDDAPAAEAAVRALMVERVLGDAGRMVVVEERLEGPELSVMVLTDGSGEQAVALPPARDYKRLRDGQEGPNTGGMGAVAPVQPPGDAGLPSFIMEQIILPTLRQLRAEGRPYRGILYAGLMLTRDGPQVLEFNCRGGDPETQVQLPLISPDALVDGLLAAAGVPGGDRLAPLGAPRTGEGAASAVCVVVAAQGYPDHPRAGDPITGIEAAAAEPMVLLFHAGTRRREDGALVTAGGRVLNVVGLGRDPAQARHRAYAALGQIRFVGMQFRRDIGADVS